MHLRKKPWSCSNERSNDEARLEKVRLDIALGLTYTSHVMRNGLSSVPEKLKKTIDAMVAAYQLRVSP